METFYGRQSVSNKVHSLEHLKDDVRKHGPLEGVSAFGFENHSQMLFGLLKGPSRRPEQLLNHIHERENFGFKHQLTVRNECGIPLRISRSARPPTSIWHRGTFFSSEAPDCFVLVRGVPAKLTSCTNTSITYSRFKHKHSFFDNPFPSSLLYIFLCKILRKESLHASPNEIDAKCVCHSLGNEKLLIPIVHTFRD